MGLLNSSSDLGVDEPIFTRVNALELSNFPPVLLDDDYMSMVLLNMHIDKIPVKFEFELVNFVV